MTFADAIPAGKLKTHAWIYDSLLVLGGSFLIALSAQIAIPLPFSPVPITGQTFAVLVVGMLLGCWRGTAAVLAYLAEGFLGLPVFAGGLEAVEREKVVRQFSCGGSRHFSVG